MTRNALEIDMFAPDEGTAMARGCDNPGCGEAGEYRAPKSRARLRDYYWFCLECVRIYNRSWNYFAGMDEAQIIAHMRASACWDRPSWPLGTNAGAGETRREAAEHAWHAEREARAGAGDGPGPEAEETLRRQTAGVFRHGGGAWAHFRADADRADPERMRWRREDAARRHGGSKGASDGASNGASEGGAGANGASPGGRVEKIVWALAVLDLVPPVAFDEIRAQYKVLVKAYHPDSAVRRGASAGLGSGGKDQEEEQAQADSRIRDINAAWQILKQAWRARV